MIDFGQSTAGGKPVDGKLNGSAVVNGSLGKMKIVSTPDSWNVFANQSGNSAYFEALHKARQASSVEGPRIVTVDETFVAVKRTLSSPRESPVDVSSESSSLVFDSADASTVDHITHTGHLLD